MTYTVINEMGKFIDGLEHDAIVEAVEDERTSLVVNGIEVCIEDVEITEVDAATVKVRVIRRVIR